MPALLCCAMPGAAAAKAPDTDTLKIRLEASIAERCGIAALGANDKDGGRIDRPSTISFNFRLDCNTPFRIGVSADQGAMALVEASGDRQIRRVANAEGLTTEGFATRKPYVASLQFATDQDGMVDAGDCDSNDLTSRKGDCQFFGNRAGSGFAPGRKSTAIGREGSLTVRWRGEEEQSVRLAAGDYQETLTIVVGART
ncbi:hypothetical protein [Sphingopyxis lindanitolerans]|nr:hypothetical protein [Sphingopyxis lindanitolerans]